MWPEKMQVYPEQQALVEGRQKHNRRVPGSRIGMSKKAQKSERYRCTEETGHGSAGGQARANIKG